MTGAEANVSFSIDTALIAFHNPRMKKGKTRKEMPQAPTHTSFDARIARLYRKHQELIRPVVENPREFVLLSLRQMAERLNTDPATTVRIVRRLGFAHFREFRAYLQEVAIAYATSLELMQSGSSSDSNTTANLRKCMEQDSKNIHRLRNSLDLERVAALAKRIYQARRIIIIGGDLASSLALFLEHLLLILNLPVISAVSSGRAVHLARTAEKRDLVIAVSYGRCLRMTVEALQKARSNGAYCVGVTDTFVSPVAQFANESFLASVETPSFAASYVAPMGFFNVLIVACANYRRNRTMALLKQFAQEERRGYRWYQ